MYPSIESMIANIECEASKAAAEELLWMVKELQEEVSNLRSQLKAIGKSL